MRAMILAAGRGERMRPLTDHCPKPLLEINSKPLLYYHLESLACAGIKHIVINHAYLGEQIEEAVGDGNKWGVHISYSAEGLQSMETAGGICKALPLLGDQPFIVVNADIWTDFPYQQLSQYTTAQAHLVLVDNPPHHPQGDFVLGANGEIGTKNGKKYTFSGIAIYAPSFFSDCKPGASSLAPLLKSAAQDGRVKGQHYSGEWVDVGTPQRLKAIRQKFL